MPDNDSLHAQYAEVQGRIKLHADRLWQLPFAFMSIVGISISIIDKEGHPIRVAYLFSLYVALALVILWAMVGATEGTIRALRHMMRIEKALNLETTVSVGYKLQYLPYFVMHLLVLAFCILIVLKTMH